jgi:hypothetical protein
MALRRRAPDVCGHAPFNLTLDLSSPKRGPGQLLLLLTLPRINEYMTSATVATIHGAVGMPLPLGAKFLDLIVDLSAVAPHDCPPASMYRIALRDRVWVRKLAVAAGDEIAVGAVVALFTTAPDESLEGEPVRPVRVTVAGIIDSASWFDDGLR